MLISRSAEKLNKRASQLESNYNVKTQTIVTDFTKDDTIEYYDSVLNQIKAEPSQVSMLFNCAGNIIGKLENETLERCRDSVMLNTLPAYMMTRNFLFKYPPSLEQQKAVVTMSCHNHELEPTGPSISISCKHGVNSFMEAEAINYKALGGHLMDIKPINVLTAGSGKSDKGFLSCSAEELVRDSLECLGQTDQTFGCKRHTPYAWVSEEIRILFGMSAARLWELMTNTEMKRLGTIW